MPSEQTALDILKSLPTPRVWSMLVTIFGDLAQAPQDRIDGRLLARLIDRMGIKPEAMRVALHRLRNEDWIVSHKSGRTAQHALTDRGRRESEAATPLIYSSQADLQQDWQMVLTKTNDADIRDRMQKAGFLQLQPRLYAASFMQIAPPDTVVMTGGDVPDWLAEQLIPGDLTRQFRDLHNIFWRVANSLSTEPVPTLEDTAVLRCLIVHHWRRLLLRQPYLPPALTGADWPGQVCRAEVVDLLARLPRPSLTQLNAL